MNIDRIKTIVARTEGLYAWVLRRVETDATTVIQLPGIYTAAGAEFVRHPNPHPREVINAPGEEVWVTVYCRTTKDGVEQMGEAQGQFVSDDEAGVRETLAQLSSAARGQPNKPYPVVGKDAVYPAVELADPRLVGASRPELLARVQSFSDAVLKSAARESGVEVSNLEVFIRRSRVRVDTHTGVRVEYPATRADAEVCFIARLTDKTAEHTARPHARRFEDLDPETLVAGNAALARGIAQAGPPPRFQGPVVLTGDSVRDFMVIENQPLFMHTQARAVYEKTSRYAKGKPAWGDEPLKGDGITLWSDPLVPFGPDSRIEAGGEPVRRAALLRKGCYDELWSGYRYLHYLGLLSEGVLPSGPPANTVVEPGGAEAAALVDTGKVVVVRAFSDFRADPTSGDFASEIRLGEVRENGRAVPFRGGLLIGNWFAALADAKLSSETMAESGYYGPTAIRFGSLQVAG